MRIVSRCKVILDVQAAPGVALTSALLFLSLVALASLIRPDVALAFTDAQATAGAQKFQLQCARCHGPNGEGEDNIYNSYIYHGLRAPELIGPTAFPVVPRPYQKLRHFDFHSVRDVYEFTSAVMPADQPASLDSASYWDVIAYLLQANGVHSDGKELNETTAAETPIPLMRRQGSSTHTASAGQ